MAKWTQGILHGCLVAGLVAGLGVAGCTSSSDDTADRGAGGTDNAGGSSGAAGDQAGAAGWQQANLTWYESYPDPNSEECIEYSGCDWAGQFAALDEVQPESWVREHNIVAVHSKDFDTYRLKTLRLRSGAKEIDVTVYDMCSDSDCDGCCTENSEETGFLIDIEKYTMERFGVSSGIVDFACLDC